MLTAVLYKMENNSFTACKEAAVGVNVMVPGEDSRKISWQQRDC